MPVNSHELRHINHFQPGIMLLIRKDEEPFFGIAHLLVSAFLVGQIKNPWMDPSSPRNALLAI